MENENFANINQLTKKNEEITKQSNLESNSNIELIKNIKIELREWTNEQNIGSKWESLDGGMRDDRRKIRVRNAGFEIKVGDKTIYIKNEDEDEAIKKISDFLNTTFSQEEIIELKAKFPKFTIMDNPFMVEEKNGRGIKCLMKKVYLTMMFMRNFKD